MSRESKNVGYKNKIMQLLKLFCSFVTYVVSQSLNLFFKG